MHNLVPSKHHILFITLDSPILFWAGPEYAVTVAQPLLQAMNWSGPNSNEEVSKNMVLFHVMLHWAYSDLFQLFD